MISQSRPGRRFSRTFNVVIVAVSATALLSACSAPESDVSLDSLGHIHAIDMDTQAGILYVASHNGVWEVAVPNSIDGFPQTASVRTHQVADRAQDTMGFTITDGGAMFASGHPDPAEYPDFTPPNLGLIRSTDGAKTWDHISLQQEVDFHALTAVALDNSQFRIYGYDSATGSLRISEDTGESWRFGAEIQAIDLAAATNDPNMVYATTASGLQRSTDGGVAFTPTSPSSPLVLIESIGSGVVGVDSTGSVWRTDGDSMSQTGAVDGAFEAFGAFEDGDDVWLLASDDSGLSVSSDWGKSWSNILPR